MSAEIVRFGRRVFAAVLILSLIIATVYSRWLIKKLYFKQEWDEPAEETAA